MKGEFWKPHFVSVTFAELQGNVVKSLCSNVCALETSFLVVVCASHAYKMTHIGMFLRPQLHCYEYFKSCKLVVLL